ncbi:MAG: hypothetical protein QXJ93_02070 [Candidatus Rehaiarchaeum fermentans]|nr:hypothetical protein [Candidatus Rehaiarchaeum fermentans]
MRAQINIIVIAGMMIATIIALLNGYNFINQMGLATHIYQSSEDSIYQTLVEESYVTQEATYKVDLAQFLAGLNLSTQCGYIYTNNTFSFIPVSKIYYWKTVNNICLPNDKELYNQIINYLLIPTLATINDSSFSRFVSENIYINLTKVNNVYKGQFTFYPLNSYLNIYYYRNNQSFSIYNGSVPVYEGLPVPSNISIDNFQYIIGPEKSVSAGAINRPLIGNAFFSKLPQNLQINSIISSYTVTNLGQQQVVFFDYNQSGYFHICVSPIYYINTLNLYLSSNNTVTCFYNSNSYVPYQLYNVTFTFNNINYDFQFIGNETDLSFFVYPLNFATLTISPKFIIYKYSVFYENSSQNSFLVPPITTYLQVNGYALNNAEICAYISGIGYEISNCIPLTFTYSSINYLSQDLHSAINFVNGTFPVGNGILVQGFPQYSLFNYLEYETHVVNMRSVYYFGKPLYDWYADILLLLGYPQYINPTISGTYTANPSSVSNAVLNSLLNLFDYQIPIESQFLSGTPYTIALYNLSLHAYDVCNTSNSITINYVNNSYSSIPNSSAFLPLPISLLFLYSNHINLTPSITCSQNHLEFDNCYPGFNYNLKLQTNEGIQQLSCCSPVPASEFYNSTCLAYIITNDSSLANSLSSNGVICENVVYQGVNAEECQVLYTFSSLKQKIIYSDSCPTGVEINYNGQVYNFSESFSTQHTFYGILYQSSEQYNNYVTNYSYWSFGIFNKTKLSGNYTIQAILNISGIYPSGAILLSKYPYLSNNMYALEFYGSNGLNSIYNFSNKNLIYTSAYSLSPNKLSSIEIIHNKTSLVLYVNGLKEIDYYSNFISDISLIGISTIGYPSYVNLDYLIAYNNYPNVLISSIYVKNALSLENSTFGYNILNSRSITTGKSILSQLSNEDSLDLLFLNSSTFPSEYLLQLPITNDIFLYNTSEIEILGIYKQNNNFVYKDLYWFNLTPLQIGSSIWINLTNHVPNYLVILYGPNINLPNYNNANLTFPIIIYPHINNFDYISYKLGNKNFVSNGIYSSRLGYLGNTPVTGYLYYNSSTLTFGQTGIIPDYIYNSTLDGRVYESFACVFNGKQNPAVYLLNVSYNALAQPFNSQQEIYGYNEIFPQASIVQSLQVLSFSYPTGYFILHYPISSCANGIKTIGHPIFCI